MGRRSTLLRGPHTADGADTIQLTNPELRRNPEDKRQAETSLRRSELSLTRARHIDGDLRELVTVVNYSATVEHLRLELALGVDMADIFEVRGYPRPKRGTLLPIVLEGDRATFAYDGLDGARRTTTVVATDARLDPTTDADAWPGASVVATWLMELEAGARATIGWRVTASQDDAARLRSPRSSGAARSTHRRTPTPAGERPFDAPRIQSDHELLDRTLVRSLADLATLRNDGPAKASRTSPPGSRGSRRCSVATASSRGSRRSRSCRRSRRPPSRSSAVSRRHATIRGTTRSPARSSTRCGPARWHEPARPRMTPTTAASTRRPLWLILLGETHAWTGDDAMLDRLWPNALAALGWIDESGDLDGDGFIEYQRRSKLGLLNQGWKDSGDAVRHLTAGRPRARSRWPRSRATSSPPIGRWRGWPAIAVTSTSPSGSTSPRRRSSPASRPRSGCPNSRFYAMALDGEKRPVASITSNVGQALWTGIISAERAALVAERLLAPDMFSGWGIRTFASGQIGYNPVGYHTGSIWPHDNAIIAAGLKASGATEGANLLAGRLIESAQWFPDLRLPELFCGFAREDVGAPVAYPVACSPQAWAAAAPFYLLHTMLGLRANAAAKRARAAPPHPPGMARQADDHRAPGRRRLGRPAGPPLAWPDERRAARSARVDRGHHPRLTRRAWPDRQRPRRHP